MDAEGFVAAPDEGAGGFGGVGAGEGDEEGGEARGNEEVEGFGDGVEGDEGGEGEEAGEFEGYFRVVEERGEDVERRFFWWGGCCWLLVFFEIETAEWCDWGKESWVMARVERAVGW